MNKKTNFLFSNAHLFSKPISYSLCKKIGLDYDYFSSGHYARVRRDERSVRYVLLKAKDRTKGQSYFLSFLNQDQLAEVIFPLGELAKNEVRKIARENRLPVSDKEESKDFYTGHYRDLLKRGKPGPIKDLSGNIMGQHEGIEHFTIGQRRGLGIASRSRLYVVKIDAATNTIIVGQGNDLLVHEFVVEKMNWVARVPAAGEEIKATVKVRYQSPGLGCRLIPKKGVKDKKESGKDVANRSERIGQAEPASTVPTMAEVTLLRPYKAVTPGQVATFYEIEAVLGAGFIL